MTSESCGTRKRQSDRQELGKSGSERVVGPCWEHLKPKGPKGAMVSVPEFQRGGPPAPPGRGGWRVQGRAAPWEPEFLAARNSAARLATGAGWRRFWSRSSPPLQQGDSFLRNRQTGQTSSGGHKAAPANPGRMARRGVAAQHAPRRRPEPSNRDFNPTSFRSCVS